VILTGLLVVFMCLQANRKKEDVAEKKERAEARRLRLLAVAAGERGSSMQTTAIDENRTVKVPRELQDKPDADDSD
jgi:hypothetical protein